MTVTTEEMIGRLMGLALAAGWTTELTELSPATIVLTLRRGDDA